MAAIEEENRKVKEQLKMAKLTLLSKTEKPQSEEEQLRQQMAIAAIKEAIEDTGRINDLELF